MDISIRPATAADISDLLRLNAEVHTLHVAAKPEFFRPADPDMMSEQFTQRLESVDTAVWLAHDGRTAVGYLVATTKQRPANAFSPARRWIDLEEIGVAPEHRRKGVARQLIETSVVAAQLAGIDDIELNVWSFNEVAQEAFLRMGFAPQHVRMTYAK